jgi:hypothetical protein
MKRVTIGQRRISTNTDSYQLAKEKLRQFESAQMRGDDNPLPTRTDISAVIKAYVNHIRIVKTPKSAPPAIANASGAGPAATLLWQRPPAAKAVLIPVECSSGRQSAPALR